MWKDFKAFALKGNVIDLAIAVVIGGAFGAIINSLVKDLIMPLIGVLTGGINFSDKKIVLSPAIKDATGKILKPENDLTYGVFIQTLINFVIIALSIFLVIRLISNISRKKEVEPVTPLPPVPTPSEKLLTEIRDLLKK